MSEPAPEAESRAILDGPAAFTEAVETCLEARRADGRAMAVLIIDCGIIARIDAIWGYPVGDAVRERIADSLYADVLRPGDLVGAPGRDELACLLATVDDPSVPMLAAEKTMRALKSPLWMGEEEIYPHAAIGIAAFPEHGEDAASLLQHAKCACTEASQAVERIAVYDEAGWKRLEQSLVGESRLQAAVQEDALELNYQPQYDLQLGPIMAVQLHLRWRGQATGLVPPRQAYAAADSVGAVVSMVSSILNRALRNVSEFRYRAGLDMLIGFPLPAAALRHAELPEVVERALGTWRLRAGRIVFQISDTRLLRDEPIVRDTLERLKKLGALLCIDDPELDLASLSFLATLPFQTIKLDFSSIPLEAAEPQGQTPAKPPPLARSNAAPASASRGARVAGALIDLAHVLSLQVVAYGVPNEAASGRLKELGCDYVQADFMGPALDAEEFVSRFG